MKEEQRQSGGGHDHAQPASLGGQFTKSRHEMPASQVNPFSLKEADEWLKRREAAIRERAGKEGSRPSVKERGPTLNETLESLSLRRVNHLRAIKNCAVFFVALSIIGFAASLIYYLSSRL